MIKPSPSSPQIPLYLSINDPTHSRNGKLGEVKYIKSSLVDLILNLNGKKWAGDKDKDDEISQPLNDLQLQLLLKYC